MIGALIGDSFVVLLFGPLPLCGQIFKLSGLRTALEKPKYQIDGNPMTTQQLFDRFMLWVVQQAKLPYNLEPLTELERIRVDHHPTWEKLMDKAKEIHDYHPSDSEEEEQEEEQQKSGEQKSGEKTGQVTRSNRKGAKPSQSTAAARFPQLADTLDTLLLEL